MLLIVTTTIHDFCSLLLFQIIQRLRSSMYITKKFLLHIAMKTYEKNLYLTSSLEDLAVEMCTSISHCTIDSLLDSHRSIKCFCPLCHTRCQFPIWPMQLKMWAQSVTLQLCFQVLQYMSLPHLLVRNVQLVSSYLKITLSLQKTEIEVFILTAVTNIYKTNMKN